MTNGCASNQQSHVNEIWSIVRLLSKNEDVNSIIETVEVKNCGVSERKTTECSAGTSNDISLSFGGGLEFGQILVGSIQSDVSVGLGIGRNSGESLSLDVPPDSSIYIYKIEKTYRILTGKVLAQTQSGTESEATYLFHANCSLSIVDVQTTSCSNFSAPPESSENTVNISAKEGWQSSSILVSRGMKVKIDVVSGKWTHFKGTAPYNMGIGNPDYICSNYLSASECVEPKPEAPQGALIGKIGNVVFEINSGTTITVNESGTLFLRINDGDGGLYDNDGILEIRITLMN
jgi:hypothetical protein